MEAHIDARGVGRGATDRNRQQLEAASWVAGVSDVGQRHTANEDALALSASPEPGLCAVMAVSDGVSSTDGSGEASLAAVTAAIGALDKPGTLAANTGADSAAMAERAASWAFIAAQEAASAVANPNVERGPACTLVVAIVLEGLVHVASVGDSRAYLIPDSGDALQLTVDDSLAERAVADGIPRAIAENAPGAHTITAWLGASAPPLNPHGHAVRIQQPGWLVVCTDGLWNEASDPADMADLVRGLGEREPAALASRLVAFANERGGLDNITVAVARL